VRTRLRDLKLTISEMCPCGVQSGDLSSLGEPLHSELPRLFDQPPVCKMTILDADDLIPNLCG
jgi:hypothetical protein